MHKVYLLLIIIVTPSLLFGTDDFATEMCHVDNYLKCLNIKSAYCIKAKDLAYEQCRLKYPINLDSTQEESYETAKLFGRCATEQYIANTGIDSDKFERCSKHLQPLYDKFYEAARKRLEESNRRFFEEDDALQIHSK
jgi:hypothetical protein